MSKRLVHKHFISASHNFADSQEEADTKILAKADSDRAAGRKCVSYNFSRVRDAPIDENKFLMPMYHNVPILAHKIIQRVRQNLEVVVGGSEEVGIVVESIKDCFGLGEDRLRFVQEGSSLSQNIQAGAKSLLLEPQEPFVFEAGDTPLADNLEDMLTDDDILTHIGIADLNGRETAFSGATPFFPRNYYWQVHNGTSYIACKEPNAWLFREDFPLASTDSFYSTRQGGKLDMFKIFMMLGAGLVRQAPWLTHTTIHDLMRGTTRTLRKKAGLAQGDWYFNASSIENLSPAFFGGKSLKFKVTHHDPYRIKDVDAWHDLWFYQHLMHAAIETGSPESYIPNFEEVKEYDRFMTAKDIPGVIGVLKDFKGYARRRAQALGMDYAPYSAAGEFIAPLESGARITRALECLNNRQQSSEQVLHQ